MKCIMHSLACRMIILLMAVALAACENKELCYDHTHTVMLNVQFDWSADPEAAPESMSLYLFPKDGGETLRYDFAGCTGGTIKVTRGEYDAICLNSDTRNIRLDGTHAHSAFEIYTGEGELFASLTNTLGVLSTGAPRAAGSDDQSVVLQPEMLWAASVTDLYLDGEVAPGKSRLDAALTLSPERIVATYHVTITGIENVRYLQGISATISDMAGGFHPAAATLSSRTVTIPFDMTFDRDEATATGTMLTFGHCPEDETRNHHLMVYAVMSDGGRYYFDLDVADEIHRASATGSRDIYITIDGLNLPAPVGGGSGGGLVPSIDDWRTINIDLKM